MPKEDIGCKEPNVFRGNLMTYVYYVIYIRIQNNILCCFIIYVEIALLHN